MATADEIRKLVIQPFEAMQWRQPAKADRDGNLRREYVELVGVYIQTLAVLPASSLERGIIDLLGEWQYRNWPNPRDVKRACQPYLPYKPALPSPRGTLRAPGSTDRAELREDDRAELAECLKVCVSWMKSGRIDIRHGLTAADARAEARRRIEERKNQ